MPAPWRSSRSPETRRSTMPSTSNTAQVYLGGFASGFGGSASTPTSTTTSPTRPTHNITNTTTTNNNSGNLNATSDFTSDFSFPTYNYNGDQAGNIARTRSTQEEAEGLSRALSRALAAEQARERRRAQGMMADHTASELERAITHQRRIERQIERQRENDLYPPLSEATPWFTSRPPPAFDPAEEDRRARAEAHRVHAEMWRARREGRPVHIHIRDSAASTPAFPTPPPSYTIAMLDRAPAYPFPCAPYNPYEDQGLGSGFGMPPADGGALGLVRGAGSDVDAVDHDLDVGSNVGSSTSSASSSSSSSPVSRTNPHSIPPPITNPTSNLHSNLPPNMGFTGARPAPLPGRRAPILRRDESWSQPWTVSADGIPLGIHDRPRDHTGHPVVQGPRQHDRERAGDQTPGSPSKKRRSWRFKRDKDKEAKHKRSGTVGSMIETVLSAAI